MFISFHKCLVVLFCIIVKFTLTVGTMLELMKNSSNTDLCTDRYKFGNLLS